MASQTEDNQLYCAICNEYFTVGNDGETDCIDCGEPCGIEFDHDGDPGDMDGDHATALASAGFGTDEDYGCYGGDDW